MIETVHVMTDEEVKKNCKKTIDLFRAPADNYEVGLMLNDVVIACQKIIDFLEKNNS